MTIRVFPVFDDATYSQITFFQGSGTCDSEKNADAELIAHI